ncbi:MAG: hypothetical protein PHN72_03035 [Bacilli bacterium]|nr:hypothetical protein [Bacilli bacterium]
MLVLKTISMFDLITVCAITMACVVIMIFIIIFSSKKSKKQDIEIALVEDENIEEKIEPEREPIKPLKEEVPAPEPKEPQVQKTGIEAVLEKMENELSNTGVIKIHTFEEEQEQKAIISYKELLKVAGKLKEENAVLKDELEKEETASVQEFHMPEEEVKIETKKEETKKEEPEKKFHTTEFISPVYGKQIKSPSDNTYVEKHKKTEDDKEQFLSELKDLRKNLE